MLNIYLNNFVILNWIWQNGRWNNNRRRKVPAPVIKKLFIKWRNCKNFWIVKTLTFIPKICLIKGSGISFHQHSFITWTLETFLTSTSSKQLHKVSCLILGFKLFRMKAFYIFCISSVNCFEIEVICVSYRILDRRNILNIISFLSSVIFLILHTFKIFCILVILFDEIFLYL